MKKDKEQPIDISLGKKHSMMVTSLKRVFVWGKNKEYQLGIETPPDILSKPNSAQKTEPIPKILNVPKIKKIAAGYKHSLFVDLQGNLISKNII
jgi:alpha-tubulin suppressor-like RCC1 family protein